MKVKSNIKFIQNVWEQYLIKCFNSLPVLDVNLIYIKVVKLGEAYFLLKIILKKN